MIKQLEGKEKRKLHTTFSEFCVIKLEIDI